MSKNLTLFIKMFGVLNGVKLYLNRKHRRPSTIYLPRFNHSVHFRGQATKSDILMYEQIFIKKDYDISVPFEPEVILDLGANVGLASVYFTNRFTKAKIIALEPDNNNFDFASRNLKFYTNVNIIHGAVWHKTEKIHVVDKGHGEAAFMIEPGAGTYSIKAYTIKSLMEMMNTKVIDILKIDIEGSEKEIFESGYEEWLPASKIIIVETHDRYKRGTSKAVFNAISKYDFSLEVSGENLVFYNNDLVQTY